MAASWAWSSHVGATRRGPSRCDEAHMTATMRGLKAATAAHHERLERRVNIEARVRSRAAYRDLLERFYGFYRPLEVALAPYGDVVELRPKHPLLDADI